MENKRKNLKKNQIVTFLATVAIVVLLNVIGSFVFTRFDLTSEKRYTLSPTTKEILNGLGLFGIRLLDHIIITRNSYLSLLE